MLSQRHRGVVGAKLAVIMGPSTYVSRNFVLELKSSDRRQLDVSIGVDAVTDQIEKVDGWSAGPLRPSRRGRSDAGIGVPALVVPNLDTQCSKEPVNLYRRISCLGALK